MRPKPIERLRAEIPEPFAAWRDHPFPSRIAASATLSTFHGCPPDEISSISRHLMTRHGLDVVVKLNPTLLGFERVSEMIRGEFGYTEIGLRQPDFDADLSFPRALDLIGDLDAFARDHGRKFGIKLTNTLVVENHRGSLTGNPIYLSGPPLHVLSTSLLDELHRALPGMLRVDGQDGPVEVSFSAGVTKQNIAKVAGLGVTPITVCSDLLRPGGYGRLKAMLTALTGAMTAASCADLEAWRAHEKEAALAAGFSGPVAAYVTALHDGEQNGAYTRAGTAKPLRQVDHVLEPWGCVACNGCVTVCPNDAFFRLPTPRRDGGRRPSAVLPPRGALQPVWELRGLLPGGRRPGGGEVRAVPRPGPLCAGGPSRVPAHITGRKVAVTPSPGLETEVVPLTRILNAPEGLPVDPADLAPTPT